MRIIGLAGESGSGKNTVAGVTTGLLSGLGYRIGIDTFGAPIKWVCHARGWDGRPSKYWRSEMQNLGLAARQQEQWFAQYLDRFTSESDIPKYDMVRLEQIALDWDLDKFTYWLACRNGISRDFTVRHWYELYPGDSHVHPDFLIIPDVRYHAEADLCQELGVLAFLEGSHQPLEADLGSHETESHIPSLRDRANFRFPFQESTLTAVALTERLFDTGTQEEPKSDVDVGQDHVPLTS